MHRHRSRLRNIAISQNNNYYMGSIGYSNGLQKAICIMYARLARLASFRLASAFVAA